MQRSVAVVALGVRALPVHSRVLLQLHFCRVCKLCCELQKSLENFGTSDVHHAPTHWLYSRPALDLASPDSPSNYMHPLYQFR